MDIILFKDEKLGEEYLQAIFKEGIEFKDGSIIQTKKMDGKWANFSICKNPTRDQIGKSVDLVYSFEAEGRSDFMHHRNSGINQVLCKILKEKNIMIGFDYSMVLKNPSKAHIYIGRMRLNVKLCRKYGVGMVCLSFATKENEIKDSNILDSFARMIGMNEEEIKISKKLISKKIEFNILKKNGLISDGIRVVE